jgi:ParB family transcriptional regulator, chromosome partitioning protein
VKEQHIERIPVAQIRVVNTRLLNRGESPMIVAHIREFGLKKPITVARRREPDGGGKQFHLVCGQGRLEAFIALGETKITPVIIEASRERDGAACARGECR